MLMIVVGYGMKDLVIISNTCNNSTSSEWLIVFRTFIFPKELVKDVFLENTLKRNLKKGRNNRKGGNMNGNSNYDKNGNDARGDKKSKRKVKFP